MSIANRLLEWFDRDQRELPWRASASPYETWISEVMLQQTRVETALPYYRRFLERFPTVEALAGAPLDDVLAAWSGLGYYRRARQLHRAAQIVVEQGGEIPDTALGLRELPGIGPYTAGAIASIAFGRVTPAIDGNVERVVSRLAMIEENPRSAAGRKRLLEVVEPLIDRKRPGDFNQALMELGAEICKPRSPDCRRCPVVDDCGAFQADAAEAYPVKSPRNRLVREERTVAVVERDGRVLLSRRKEDARLLAGMWELPWVAAVDDRAVEALAERYGGEWCLASREVRVRHAVTTRQLDVSVRRADWTPPADTVAEVGPLTWVDAGSVRELPTTALVDKAIAALRDDD